MDRIEQAPASLEPIAFTAPPAAAPERRRGGTVLVLGGGGARGFAHFGVLLELQKQGIQIDRIVGVSIGAFVGAVWCQNPDAAAATARVRDYITSARFSTYYRHMTQASKKSRVHDEAPGQNGHGHNGNGNGQNGKAPDGKISDRWLGRLRQYMGATMAIHRVITSLAILSHRPMEDCLSVCARNMAMETLAVPLTVVAADLRSGKKVAIESGDLFSAVLGSTALPGIFPPIERDGALLADYGVMCSIPVPTARTYEPDAVIAVDLSPEVRYRSEFKSGLEILNRVEEIGCFLFKEHVAQQADVIIRPQVSHVDWADFAHMDPIVEEGRRATEAELPALLRLRAQTGGG
jgi:NTE family protein